MKPTVITAAQINGLESKAFTFESSKDGVVEKVLELYWVDKASWGEGPWQGEPDKVQWVDEETGLDCLVVRNYGGALCGYVGVPESHPCFKVDYDDCSLHKIECHGGLTFSGLCDEKNKEHGICHIGEDKVWWLGFDCAHGFDIKPAMSRYDYSFDAFRNGIESMVLDKERRDLKEEYRDLKYVKNEIKNLAKQLSEMKNLSEVCV